MHPPAFFVVNLYEKNRTGVNCTYSGTDLFYEDSETDDTDFQELT